MWSNLWTRDSFVPELHLEMLIKLWYRSLNAESLISAFWIPLWLRWMQRALLCWTYGLVMGGYLAVQLQAEWANVLSGVCHQFQFLYGIPLARWWSFLSCDELIFPWHCNHSLERSAEQCLAFGSCCTCHRHTNVQIILPSPFIILDGIKADES